MGEFKRPHRVTEAHTGKLYHLGIGKSVTRSKSYVSANEQRDYRIFQEYATFMIAEARVESKESLSLTVASMLLIPLTIDLVWLAPEWANLRKHKGGIKSLKALYDVGSEVPAFVHTFLPIFTIKAMSVIPRTWCALYI